MKCSSRRNCNQDTYREDDGVDRGLNEVQLPKELQRPLPEARCSSKKSLNEVQLPKELQPHFADQRTKPDGLNEVQLPKELQLRMFGRATTGL